MLPFETRSYTACNLGAYTLGSRVQTACSYHGRFQPSVYYIQHAVCRLPLTGCAGRYRWLGCLHGKTYVSCSRRYPIRASLRENRYRDDHVTVSECEDDFFGCPL